VKEMIFLSYPSAFQHRNHKFPACP
jgi:hypothetical protein